MIRFCIALCCLFAVSALTARSEQEQQDEAVSVRIVPTSFREKGGRVITLWDSSQHFYVVVTNTSEKSIRLWREWNSWGEQMLSFRVTDENGKVIVVNRTPRAYDKNYPDWTTIPPGDHMVFEVSFAPKIWPAVPLPEQDKSRKVKMQAIFQIVEDRETKENKVWTGKAFSPEHTYTIYR